MSCMAANMMHRRFGAKKVVEIESDNESSRKSHLHSADLFAYSAPAQVERQKWRPVLPDLLDSKELVAEPVQQERLPVAKANYSALKTLLPHICDQQYVELRPALYSEGTLSLPQTPPDTARMGSISSKRQSGHALRVGLILSGGPAPGGHSVIAGLYDYVKRRHPDSQVFGMLGGLDGLLMNRYTILNDDIVNRFRNMGGFDMLWSGRGRVNSDDDKETARIICEELELRGLVIVGGDGSNSNAAILANHFAEQESNCVVVGVPKTIDGDLKNKWIETSFGFDTCAKTYSELIGNLCTDVRSAQSVYHFTRVMGRSASHLVLECALQTRPNLVFIGEEVERNNITLQTIVTTITDLIVKRHKNSKRYGVFLVPEGLIEFIPEVKKLIEDMNPIVSNGEFCPSKLPDDSRQVWDFLPDVIQEQLLSDREATGYIQVAKVATERLLILLTEAELTKRGLDPHQFVFMPHYFGYEGRCAMPSNFDSNYCYALGCTAGGLIEFKINGCMAVLRGLDQHASLWVPCGLPFTYMMEVKTDVKGKKFPAVTKSLVDLEGPLFKVFSEVRNIWSYEDLYRCPGPIQFEGETADLAHFSVQIPNKEELLWGMLQPTKSSMLARAMCPTKKGCLGLLQKERLKHKPIIPDLCSDLKARAIFSTQQIPNDPYTRRQILIHYPYMTNNNHFTRVDVVHDKYTPPISSGLKIGLVFLSRQSPGVINVLWGLYERLQMVGGSCVGFYGLDGLVEGRGIENLNAADLELFVNQGGVDLLGRSTKHSLIHEEKRDKACQTCKRFGLDGLLLVGSAFAMTEAAMLTEHFFRKQCSTSVIGVPATGSNNIGHELIETCIGFDSSTKVYASLIGNILTDAASMPKYWHFIRLMGRQPSHEVLECALQTHPNVVIIAEEYGAADKTLAHVVNDIADTVCLRASLGKNFGTVLIPDALLLHLPNMKILLSELGHILKEAEQQDQLKDAQKCLMELDDESAMNAWVKKVSPWSLALFKTFPKLIRREMLQVDAFVELKFTTIETEEILSRMVKEELKIRAEDGRYVGKFQSVTHFFGYQGRSSLPSIFDCSLAFAHGHLACILVESGLTGYCTTVRGLCGEAKDWKLAGVPLLCLLQIVPNIRDSHHNWGASSKSESPVVPSAEVSLNGRAFRWMKTALEQWALHDRFCNPGPIQFEGPPSLYYNRVLHEEQSEYFEMVRLVQCYTSLLNEVCRFGVRSDFLKAAFVSLNGLLTLAAHPEDLSSSLPPLIDVKTFLGEGESGCRPNVKAADLPPALSSGAVMPSEGILRSGTSQYAGVKRESRNADNRTYNLDSIQSFATSNYNDIDQRLVNKRSSLKGIDEAVPQLLRGISKDNLDLVRKRSDVPSLPGVESGPYSTSNIEKMIGQQRS